MGTERERRHRRLEGLMLDELVLLGGGREVAPRPRHRRGAGHVEAARGGVELDVGDICLEQAGGDALGLLDESDGGLVHGGAALLQRTAAHRAEPHRSEVGVAPHEGEPVDVDARLRAGDHRPGGVVSLAVRRGAGVDGARAVGVDLDLRARVAGSLVLRPLTEVTELLHEGDRTIRDGWPFNYWGLEPLDKSRPDWKTRYACAFQVPMHGVQSAELTYAPTFASAKEERPDIVCRASTL